MPFVHILLYPDLSNIRTDDFRPSDFVLRHAQGTPLNSEMGWTGELWSNGILLILEYCIAIFLLGIKNKRKKSCIFFLKVFSFLF